MATTPITLNIDSTLINEAVTALCTLGGYQSTITNADGTTSPNPQTQNQFAKQQVINFVMNQITENRNRTAQSAVTAPASNLIS